MSRYEEGRPWRGWVQTCVMDDGSRLSKTLQKHANEERDRRRRERDANRTSIPGGGGLPLGGAVTTDGRWDGRKMFEDGEHHLSQIPEPPVRRVPSGIRHVASEVTTQQEPNPLYGWHAGPGGGAPARDESGRIIGEIRGLRGGSLTPVLRDPDGSKKEYAESLLSMADEQARRREQLTLWSDQSERSRRDALHASSSVGSTHQQQQQQQHSVASSAAAARPPSWWYADPWDCTSINTRVTRLPGSGGMGVGMEPAAGMQIQWPFSCHQGGGGAPHLDRSVVFLFWLLSLLLLSSFGSFLLSVSSLTIPPPFAFSVLFLQHDSTPRFPSLAGVDCQ
jgi:hypothetical protein